MALIGGGFARRTGPMSRKGTLVARSKVNATGGDRAEHEGVAESEMYVRFVNGNEAKASVRQLWCVQIGYCHTVLRATIWSYGLELRDHQSGYS